MLSDSFMSGVWRDWLGTTAHCQSGSCQHLSPHKISHATTQDSQWKPWSWRRRRPSRGTHRGTSVMLLDAMSSFGSSLGGGKDLHRDPLCLCLAHCTFTICVYVMWVQLPQQKWPLAVNGNNAPSCTFKRQKWLKLTESIYQRSKKSVTSANSAQINLLMT